MQRANPYDPEGIRHQHFATLIGGRYRMRTNYRIRRPEGTHDCLLLLTLAGLGLLRHPEGDTPLPPGTLALHTPGTPHDYATAPTPGLWDFAWVHFRPPEAWATLFRWPEATPGLHILSLAPFPPPFRRRIRALFVEAIRLAAQASPRGDALAMNLLENIFLRCTPEPTAPTPADAAFAERLRAHIHANLRADLSVEALARCCALSPSRFAHRFTQAFGLPPRAYVERCRLERARRLIVAGECTTVKAAAYTVGFSSPDLFARRFRSLHGIPPSALLPRNPSNEKANQRTTKRT